MAAETAAIGVFGGSGLYELLDDITEVALETPYGSPSGPLHLGTLGDRRVAFLPRHGADHAFPPHRINYRANVWAMREVGVSRILAPCASGSLQPDVEPGDFVVCDQLVDRTYDREQTYFDGPGANHVSFADPYCPELRAVAITAGRDEGITVHEAGTVVVVQGPRFSTRAESNWYRSAGWQVINMTQYPEAYLARELGICYVSIALITDYDVGVEGIAGVEPVTQEEVFAFFDRNVDRVRGLLYRAIQAVPAERACSCADGPNGMVPPPPLPA
ncbi:MAG: S-methyl-5'-thioadenosine phosphorylase [Acidimicrobiales bacterium]